MDSLSSDLKKLDRSSKEKANTLDTNRWLEGFSWDLTLQLAGYTDFYYISKGGLIFNQGDQLPYICLILDGKIDILKETEAGQKSIAKIGKGHTIGEMTLIDGEPRSATATAASECELCLLSISNFQRIRADVPVLWGTLLMRFIKTVTQRLRRSSGVLVELLDNASDQCDISLSEQAMPDKGVADINMVYSKLFEMNKNITSLAEQPFQFALGDDLFNKARKQALIEGSDFNEWLQAAVTTAVE